MKFEIELEDDQYKTYTEEDFKKAETSAAEVFETVEEYLDHVFIFKTVKDGTTIWVGIN